MVILSRGKMTWSMARCSMQLFVVNTNALITPRMHEKYADVVNMEVLWHLQYTFGSINTRKWTFATRAHIINTDWLVTQQEDISKMQVISDVT